MQVSGLKGLLLGFSLGLPEFQFILYQLNPLSGQEFALDYLWATLDVLMVCLLYKVEGCEAFWCIQFIQILELIPWVCGWSFGTWMQFDVANFVMECAGIACLRKMPVAWVLMMGHVVVKAAIYKNVTMPWEYHLGGLQSLAYWVNNLTLLAILAYTRPIPRLRDLGARCRTSLPLLILR